MGRMTVPALGDYGNAWVTQYTYLCIYNDHAKKGNQKGMEDALELIIEHVDKPDDYQKKHDTKFEPDFTKPQKHRMNYLAEIYNHLAGKEDIDVDAMHNISKIPIRLIREWSNPDSIR